MELVEFRAHGRNVLVRTKDIPAVNEFFSEPIFRQVKFINLFDDLVVKEWMSNRPDTLEFRPIKTLHQTPKFEDLTGESSNQPDVIKRAIKSGALNVFIGHSPSPGRIQFGTSADVNVSELKRWTLEQHGIAIILSCETYSATGSGFTGKVTNFEIIRRAKRALESDDQSVQAFLVNLLGGFEGSGTPFVFVPPDISRAPEQGGFVVVLGAMTVSVAFHAIDGVSERDEATAASSAIRVSAGTARGSDTTESNGDGDGPDSPDEPKSYSEREKEELSIWFVAGVIWILAVLGLYIRKKYFAANDSDEV
jgi:hypothetical protein